MKSSRGARAIRPRQPTVFLGPSLSWSDARRILKADYRRPIRHGDLQEFGRGAMVAIIDGRFEERTAVTPGEIRAALRRGVRVWGSATMGALCASQIPGVQGVGQIYELFKSGALVDEDEVAVAFDETTLAARSEPLCNVRHAVQRLVGPGTIDRQTAERILRSAEKLPYPDRTYPRVLNQAGLGGRTDTAVLAQMLRAQELTRQDALTLLERLRRESTSDLASTKRPGDAPPDAAYLWEYGERVGFGELLAFLKITGAFAPFARRVLGRRALAGPPMGRVRGKPGHAAAAQRLVNATRRQWSWFSAEEAQITLADLHLEVDAFVAEVQREVDALSAIQAAAREESTEFLEALRAELVLNDLSLKRQVIRAGTVRCWAQRCREAGEPGPTRAELEATRARVCEWTDTVDWLHAQGVLKAWGVQTRDLERWMTELSLARRVGGRVLEAMAGMTPARARVGGPLLKSSPKAGGDPRFTAPIAKALRVARRVSSVIGITRLAVLPDSKRTGIPTVAAYRPSDKWAIAVGSGKSESVAGATVGAILEEAEKWCQEHFPRRAGTPPELMARFSDPRRGERLIDPRRFGIPHDSLYTPDQVIGWRQCEDLLGGGTVWVASALVDRDRCANDVLYSPRLGHKEFGTNGLASGLTLEEAVTHAACEFIERHAAKIAALEFANPGFEKASPRVVDPRSLPGSSARLFRKLVRLGRVRVLDITSDIAVPTFWSRVVVPVAPTGDYFGAGMRVADGFGAHPNPEVAVNMSMLEVAQAIVGRGLPDREHLSVHARSLGRSERTSAESGAGYLLWRGLETPSVHFGTVRGLCATDCREDVRWILKAVAAAGLRHVLLVDYSVPRLRPVRVVRVLIPDAETNASYSTGERARASLLRDLLPPPHAG